MKAKYLLTLKDAKAIVKKYDNHQFWESEFEIDGYKLSTFNYFLCDYNDFKNPLGEKSEVTAFDMRCTTFVRDSHGELISTFYMLPKFFNVNQVEATQYNKISKKKIKHISVKEDGSLIAFMQLPNGKIFSKTIGSFVSEQAIEALKILNKDSKMNYWVRNLLVSGYTPLFEYVARTNRIVLKYSAPELRFIGIRDNETGDYFPAKYKTKKPLFYMEHIPESVKKVQAVNFTLAELEHKAKVETEQEGWVVLFNDGEMIKWKLDWYFNLHGLRTQNIFREDFLIRHILEDTIDDIKSQLDPNLDGDAFDFIAKVSNALDKHIKFMDESVKVLYSKMKDECNMDLSKFGKKYNKEAFFHLTFSYDDKGKYTKKKIEAILKRTSKLHKAKDFIDNLTK